MTTSLMPFLVSLGTAIVLSVLGRWLLIRNSKNGHNIEKAIKDFSSDAKQIKEDMSK